LLISALRAAIPVTTSELYIAYSGGVDSYVLLHVCSELIEFKGKITAVYVHHGLQAIAESWGIHCQREAEKLGVSFQLLRVNAQSKKGESPEEAARNARYQALKPLLTENDVLLVAQHREDQLETVLLQLFRGAGIQGLAAMPKAIAFGNGQILRPFLDVSKQTIQAYAEEYSLTWVADPSNACDDFDRNFLRNQLIPLVKTRWGQVDKTVARTAQHCAAAQMLLNEVAENLLAEILNEDNTLSISQLQQFSHQKQSLVIRTWFNQQGLKMPSAGFISAIFTEVIHAKTSAEPSLKKAGVVIRRYQDKLYCLKDLSGFKNLTGLIWQAVESQVVLPDGSVLVRYLAHDGIPLSLWQQAHVTVRFRQGGEKIRLAGRQGLHTLKNLFQEAQIPPWQRDRVPLLYFDDQLVAVANLWLSSEVQAVDNESCYQIDWLPSQ
jgi:tRNA(Ile)-lysidine synthase